MSSVLLSISLSLMFTAPGKLPQKPESPVSRAMNGEMIIAQQYAGDDPHGPDPHGGDPHDENHDGGLKANSADYDRTAPYDVYGGIAPGANSPHPLSNFPGQPGF
jgi:hypothetical protein